MTISQTDRSSAWFPANASGSRTITAYFYARANSDVGNFGGMTAVHPESNLTTLSIVFPNGANDGVTFDAIVDAVVTHALNSNLADWWSPGEGLTVKEALYACFSSLAILPDNSSGRNLLIRFNGQFGGASLSVG